MQAAPNISEDPALIEFIESEVRLAFEKPESPRFSFPVSAAVQCLFDVLHHRIGDADLDAVGNQVLQAFQSYRERNDFLNLPDRLEAFLKFVQRLLKPAGLGKPTGSASRDRMFLPEVLQALGLADASTVGAQTIESLEGKPRFALQVARAIQARNEVHRARAYSAREKAEVFESVCVVMVFAVCEVKEKLSLAILASRYRQLLERYRDGFGKWRGRFVDLEGQEQSTDEFEGIDPLAVEIVEDSCTLQNDTSESENPTTNTKLGGETSDQRRGLVRDLVRSVPKLILLGDPGSGKTTTLQYLAWNEASGLLKNPGGDWWFPIYIPLKTFASAGTQTIEALIQSEMESVSLKRLAKQRCLILLDGLNEVPEEHLIAAKHEIQSLLLLGDNVRVVMTCRPGQFQNEFGLPAFELQPLKDDQIHRFLQRNLRDDDKVRRLLAVLKRQPKLWEWARNPFMLAMLVRVFLKKGNIPENRGRLMQAFLGDIMRREQAQGAARTPLETKTTLLARLAFESRKLALLSFPRIDACTWVKHRRDELGSTLDVPLFIDEVLTNNLLAETTGGLLTFDHELYQEYFCAVTLLEMGDKGVALIEDLQMEPRWEEPIVLYSGISDCRSSVLRSLAITNVHLAAKSLTSSSVVEGADREAILLKAKALTGEAIDPSKVADGLLSLAELGEAEAMIAVLKKRGAGDDTAQKAIRSFIPKCPPELVVGWIQQTSDYSDKFLVSWMLAAIAPDQKKILLRDHREALKELLLWQVRRSSQGAKQLRHIHRLLMFFGDECRGWLIVSLAKDILARIDNGAEDQWLALTYLLRGITQQPDGRWQVNQWQAPTYLGEGQGDLADPNARTAFFAAALNRCEPYSIGIAVLIWLRHLLGQDLSFVFQFADEETLKRSIRLLHTTKSVDYHQLALSLSNALRRHRARGFSDNAKLLKTTTARLQRLAELMVGEVRRNCFVKAITDFGAFIELETGIGGLLPFTDMCWDPPVTNELMLKLNQTIDVMLLEIDDTSGNVAVGLKQMVFVRWDKAESKYPTGTRAKVKVIEIRNDRAIVELEACIEGVIAREHLSWGGRMPKVSEILAVGQEVEAVVLGLDRHAMRFSLSIRLVEADPWERIEALYPVGSSAVGKITNLVDYGGFISIRPGVNGLLHISEMSWGRLKHPSSLFEVGQELEVVILTVEKEKKRLSFGLKQRLPSPWGHVNTKYAIGQKVKVKVINLVPYGVFVELEPGVEGLVHVSELTWTRGNVKPSDILKEDQEIEAVVLGINHEEKKISLSVRQLEPSPWDKASEKYPAGTLVKGLVRNITSYGAFVELEEGIDGMVHVSDISWTRKIGHPSQVFKKGDEVAVVVLDIDDANKRISLGLKQLTEDPWQNIEKCCKVGDLVNGKVSEIANLWAFVALEHDLIGFLHISELAENQLDDIEEILTIGQEITTRVIAVDKEQRQIGLSMKSATS